MGESETAMPANCPECGAPLPSGVLGGLCPACLLKQGSAETATEPEMAPFHPPSLEEMARLFPQLEIQGFIGKGGMGAVYKARQPVLDRLVALKILPPQVASGPGFAERFNREARALAKLSHPNIVAVHEFGQVNSLPYFIMEFVDGLNLRQLERAGRMSPREALQIVPQICEALQFAHDEGIVHRDIKPENILLDKKGRVKIADFGIAKIMGTPAEPTITEARAAIGTPQYMAPEQVEKPESVDHRADIFSLGVVFYEMLTGELPIGRFAPPSRKVDVDVRLDEVVLRALEREPGRRYQHASQVRTDVDTITSQSGRSAIDAKSLVQDLLVRDYDLNVGSCLSRGWQLVKDDFWPMVGIVALILLLVHVASSTAVGIVAGGPLMGGLWLFLLRRVRGQAANVETAFSGFRIAFVDLFLAWAVMFVLTLIGFLLFLLPGIYLTVAWMFALLIVIDQRLPFWPALEMSRRVVNRHWFKLFWFSVVLLLINVLGLLFCVVGFFLTAPITLAATVFAYEDIFRAAEQRAGGQPTMAPARSGSGAWIPIAAGAAALVLLLLATTYLLFRTRSRAEAEAWMAQQQAAEQAAALLARGRSAQVYGPVVERLFEFTDSNRRALNLASGDFVASSAERPLFFVPDSIATLREAGVDLYLSETAIEDLTNAAAIGELEIPVLNALDSRALEPIVLLNGDAASITNLPQNVFEPLDDQASPNAEPEQILRGTNVYQLITRDGSRFVLQMTQVTDDPAGVRVLYRPLGRPLRTREDLVDRIEAAGSISSVSQRSHAFARLAGEAASFGDVELVKQSLREIGDVSTRDQAALDSARLLAHGQHRRQAIEVAKSIISSELRDTALAELAQ